MVESEFLRVAELVLREKRRPLTAMQLWQYGSLEGLFSDRLSGKTPWQTMKSKLSVHIRRYGQSSRFVRTEPGRYYLRELLGDDEEPYEAKPWRPPAGKERVVVFPSYVLDRLGRFQGIRRSFEGIYDALFRSDCCFEMDRMEAEAVDDHKQVLIYIMVRKGDQLLAYRRGVYNRTEDMLRGSDCIGFGGHVNSDDLTLLNDDHVGIKQAAVRELCEEIDLPLVDRDRLALGEGLSIVGLLNDDSSAVGRRHFAVILEYRVSDSPRWDSPKGGEKSIARVRWIDSETKGIRMPDFEYWSQLLLRFYASDIVRLQPAYSIRRRRPLTPPHLLCIVGQVGSGKSEAARVLRDEFGYSEVNSGEVVARLLGIPPVPYTPRLTFQEQARDFISGDNGPQALAEAIIARAEVSASRRLLVDGVRQLETLRQLKILAGSLRIGIIYVSTPPDVAFSFYQHREAPEADILDFVRVRESAVENEVPLMLDLADVVLYNWFGRPDYAELIRTFMAEANVQPV